MDTLVFLFLDKNDMPMVALHWEKYLEHIVQKYNKNLPHPDAEGNSSCVQTHLLFQYGKIRG